jgi:hypothetical protein
MINKQNDIYNERTAENLIHSLLEYRANHTIGETAEVIAYASTEELAKLIFNLEVEMYYKN